MLFESQDEIMRLRKLEAVVKGVQALVTYSLLLAFVSLVVSVGVWSCR